MKKALTMGTVFLMALVLLAALACGPAATAETTVQNPATQEPAAQPDAPVRISATQNPTAQPETPAAPQPGTVEKPAPIDGVEIGISADDPPSYTLKITSGLPGGCVRFSGYTVSQVGNNIHVAVANLEPAGQVLCTDIYGSHEGSVDLGADFTPGEAYTVVVNGKVTNSFTARGPEVRTWTVKESPIQGVEVVIMESFPPRYRLNILSTLPAGSSCSRFNGYDVARPSANSIVLVVTHLEEPGGNVPCTTDLPVVETVVSLGSGFESGEEYTVVINGQLAKTFTAQ